MKERLLVAVENVRPVVQLDLVVPTSERLVYFVAGPVAIGLGQRPLEFGLEGHVGVDVRKAAELVNEQCSNAEMAVASLLALS